MLNADALDTLTAPVPADPPPREARPLRILRVSWELLAELLRLPPGTRIVNIGHELFLSTDQVALVVEHPDFKPITPPEAIPTVTAWYRAVTTPVFAGWRE